MERVRSEPQDLVSPEQTSKWHNFVGSTLSIYRGQTCANRAVRGGLRPKGREEDFRLRRRRPRFCRQTCVIAGCVEALRPRPAVGGQTMSRRLDWTKARFVGRPTSDFRREFEVEDRADRWLRAVARNQAQRRQRPRERTFRPTQASSTEPPW
jgi:hypothetical protein